MTRSERFDLELPDDFPVAAVESLHAHLSDRHPDANQTTEWKEWANAVNGVLYRFRACDEDGQAVDRRAVVPRFVTDRFNAHDTFGSETIAIALDAVITSNDFEEWRDIRNFLGHRGAPGRKFYQGGDRHGGADWNLPIPEVDVTTILEPAELRRRREWLGVQVREVCAAADAFAVAHVP